MVSILLVSYFLKAKYNKTGDFICFLFIFFFWWECFSWFFFFIYFEINMFYSSLSFLNVFVWREEQKKNHKSKKNYICKLCILSTVILLCYCTTSTLKVEFIFTMKGVILVLLSCLVLTKTLISTFGEFDMHSLYYSIIDFN